MYKDCYHYVQSCTVYTRAKTSSSNTQKIQRSMESELQNLINKVTLLDKIVQNNIDYRKNKMKDYYDKKSKLLTSKVSQLAIFISIV